MKSKISAALLIIIVLLGVSANTAVYAQIITPQQPPTDTVKPVQTLNPNSNKNIQPASIDLNNPIGSGQNLQSNFLINCPTGVVVYQPSLITNEIVPICITSDMLNSQLFNIDVEVKDDNKDNDNDDDNNDHDGNDHHKKHFKHYPVYYNKNFWNHYWSNTHPGKINNDKVVLTDPRDDPKYDSIDWRSDDGKSDLSIQEMDKILEDQQNKKGNTDNQGYQPLITTFTTTSATAPAVAVAPTSNQNIDTIASDSGDSVENTDDNGDSVETQESTESESESGSSSDSDGGDIGSSDGSGDSNDGGDGGDNGSDGGSEGGSDGGSDEGGENNN